MSKFDLSSDLDQRLHDSIAHQGDFLANLGLVLALLNDKVIAPNPLFSVTVNEQNVLPIFTTEPDWEVFMSKLTNPPEGVKWETIPFTYVLNAVLSTPIDSIGFNLKTSDDKETGNLFYSDKGKLQEFIEAHNKLMNDLMNPENQAADRLEKTYLVPVYVGARSYGDLVRAFPTLISPEYGNKEVLPVFDNIESFVKWYRYPDFGGAFSQNNGQIRGMRLSELVHPSFGENQFGNSVGVVIDPMEIEAGKQDEFILTWDVLKDLKSE